MKFVIFDPRRGRAISTLGILAAIVLFPFFIVIKLLTLPFERPKKRSVIDVSQFIRDFLDGTGDQRDWDDFISIPIADPHLEEIRADAANVQLPLTEEGRRILQSLLAKAHQLSARKQSDAEIKAGA